MAEHDNRPSLGDLPGIGELCDAVSAAHDRCFTAEGTYLYSEASVANWERNRPDDDGRYIGAIDARLSDVLADLEIVQAYADALSALARGIALHLRTGGLQ